MPAPSHYDDGLDGPTCDRCDDYLDACECNPYEYDPEPDDAVNDGGPWLDFVA